MLVSISGEALGGAIGEYERLRETLDRVMSYASLIYAGDMSDAEIGRFYQMMQERVTDIGSTLLFFTLELNKLADTDLAEKLKAPALAHYEPWLRHVPVLRPHQLSP